MILSGEMIRSKMGGDICIDPFDPLQLNPNSYNLTLHNELMIYEEVVLDMRQSESRAADRDSARGLVLSPNQLYLGRTVERTETHNLVPMIEGRSSIGRLGLFVHVTAGFGDVGFCGYLDAGDVRGAAGAHLSGRAHLPDLLSRDRGRDPEYASDKYQHNRDIQPSLLFKELNPDAKHEDPQLTLDFGTERFD